MCSVLDWDACALEHVTECCNFSFSGTHVDKLNSLFCYVMDKSGEQVFSVFES